MKSVITKDNLSLFAYTNLSKLTGKPKAIVIEFLGLGCDTSEYSADDNYNQKFCLNNDIVYIVPRSDPWSWMNEQAVKMADDIIDLVYDIIGCVVPIISTGGSMGGECALVFTTYSKHNIISCIANCPVCDMLYHYTERVDLPSTMYAAFGNCDCDTLEKAIELHSPYHLVMNDKMPKDKKFYIFHCTNDRAVNKELHSDKMVSLMTDKGYNVQYFACKDRGHCDLTPEMWDIYRQKIIESIE